MIRLHLVRHGQCEVPPDGGMLGQRDMPLTELGRCQAAALGERFRETAFVAAYSSDLRRSIETSRLLLGERDTPLSLDARLREFDIGAWEGLDWDAVEARWPGSMVAFTAPREGLAFPGGETLAAVGERVRAFLDDVRSGPEGDVLVVAHQGSLTVLLALALGMPEWGWSRFILSFASVTVLELYPHQPLLASYNDTHHLLALDHAR